MYCVFQRKREGETEHSFGIPPSVLGKNEESITQDKIFWNHILESHILVEAVPFHDLNVAIDWDGAFLPSLMLCIFDNSHTGAWILMILESDHPLGKLKFWISVKIYV